MIRGRKKTHGGATFGMPPGWRKVRGRYYWRPTSLATKQARKTIAGRISGFEKKSEAKAWYKAHVAPFLEGR